MYNTQFARPSQVLDNSQGGLPVTSAPVVRLSGHLTNSVAGVRAGGVFNPETPSHDFLARPFDLFPLFSSGRHWHKRQRGVGLG